MGDLSALILVIVVICALIALGWWLLIESEGVYLGRRVVIWLYDVYAGRYDAIKHFRRDYDNQYLAQPIMMHIAPNKAPFMLDVATGTGRLPLAMLRYASFGGRVIGVDLSRRMLEHAAPKFVADSQVMLVLAPAERLPFHDETFDVVTCLEALEFTSDMRVTLIEIVRVLKPGGLLLITNRISTRFMPGKTLSTEGMIAVLMMLGIDRIRMEKWQVDYDQVWGFKPDAPSPP